MLELFVTITLTALAALIPLIVIVAFIDTVTVERRANGDRS
jgi:hypothetical protein